MVPLKRRRGISLSRTLPTAVRVRLTAWTPFGIMASVSLGLASVPAQLGTPFSTSTSNLNEYSSSGSQPPEATRLASPSHFCTAESSPPPTVPIFRRPHSLMGSPRLPTAELRAPDSVSRAFPRRSASCHRGGPYQPANPPGGLRDSIIRQMRPTCVCSSERVSGHSFCPNSSINPAHQRADAVPE